MINTTVLLYVLALVEPAGFTINLDANQSAVYVLKYNNKIIQPGKEITIYLLKDTQIELTFTYLDNLEEVTKSFKIKVKPGYTASYTIRLRAYPGRVRT